MLRAGLIGTPLGHSGSADYFAEHHPDCRYRAYDKASVEGLRRWVEEERLDGFNVTLPYKGAIIEQLDEVDETARRIGAVNCVCVRRENGATHLMGYNTDYQAFAETLRPLLPAGRHQAWVLGTGGAAHAVAYALQQMGIDHTFVSRQPLNHRNAIGYDQLERILQFEIHNSQFTILINATPVGMWPHTEESPIPNMDGVGHRHLCYDLVYNPGQTRWLREAAERGAAVRNGLAMLHRQAELSYELWRR